MKKDNHYVAWGLTAVVVVCAILLFYDIVFRHSIILVYLSKLIAILAPVLNGFAMAYLLTPVVNVGNSTAKSLDQRLALVNYCCSFIILDFRTYNNG